MINPYSKFGYISPQRDSEDCRPRYSSYQEHFEHRVLIYYNWWAHRHPVTVQSILWKLGLSDDPYPCEKPLTPWSIDYEAAMSALRMHGVDVGYNEDGKLVRY